MHPVLQLILDRYLDGDHSVYSPSSSKMWLTCPGSLIPNVLAPDKAMQESAEGSIAHWVAETWLRAGRKPRHLLGTRHVIEDDTDMFFVTVDEDMMDYVQQSVDRCILLPGEHLIEQRVDFSRLTPIPRQKGTLDHAAIQKTVARVTDHKFGAGVPVYAQANSQAMLYTIELLDTHPEIQTLEICINQPRRENFDEWVTTRDHVMEFAGYVRERARIAWDVNAPRKASAEGCQFCKIKSTCPANIKMQFDLMADLTAQAFEIDSDAMLQFKRSLDDDIERFDPTIVDPLALTTSQLAHLRPYGKIVKSWWDASDNELMRRIVAGENVPNYKIVEGRTHRYFPEIRETIEHLVDLGCSRGDVELTSTVSPAEAEKLLVKAGQPRKELPNLLSGLVKKPKGKPTLAHVSDRRPSIVDLSGIVFSDLDNQPVDPEEL